MPPRDTSAANAARRRKPEQRRTFADDLASGLRELIERDSRITFPSARYRDDPVAFARDILGVDPWSRQCDLLRAVATNRRVACKSGRRVSKSWSAAILALWFYCSFEDAQVVFTSVTAKQVNAILWRALKKLKGGSGRCLSCKRADPRGPVPCPHSAVIDGDIGELPSTGLKSRTDQRSVYGYTAREAEAFQGIAGTAILFIIDEASGVSDAIFEAIEGNRAGGARVVYLGNPTKTKGEFFKAFTSKKDFYFTLTISSVESPNVAAKAEVIEGLATSEWIDEKRREWGEDSALYRIHILGEFATHEDGRIFSVESIADAERRWDDTEAAGRLYVGVDPAGATGLGDETVFCARRGLKVLEFERHRGLTADGHIAHLLGFLTRLRIPREEPVVVLDREGNIGNELSGALRAFLAGQRISPFVLVGVRASDRAHRQPGVYDRMRDELCANLESFFRDGGAIPEDTKLADELHALEWEHQNNGRLKVTAKNELRRDLGRSPDTYDALALACWEPLSLREGVPANTSAYRTAQQPVAPPAPERSRPALDPYAARSSWKRR